MSQTKIQTLQRNSTTGNLKSIDEDFKDDLKRRFEIMRLYTSRNSDSKSLIKNLSEFHSKPHNTSLKNLVNTNNQSVINNDFGNQLSKERYQGQCGEFSKQVQALKNITNNKYNSNQRDKNNNQGFNDKKSMVEDKYKEVVNFDIPNQFDVLLNSQNRTTKSKLLNKKISVIASGSSQTTLMKDEKIDDNIKFQQAQNILNKKNNLKLIIQPFEQNFNPLQFQSLSNQNKDGKLNLNSIKGQMQRNPFQSTLKEFNKLKEQKYFNNNLNHQQQNRGFSNKQNEKSIDMASSYQGLSFQNQMSPLSKIGYNQVKETMTTQESNNGDFTSDRIISDVGARTKETFQKQNPFKSIKYSNKYGRVSRGNYFKDEESGDESQLFNSVKFSTEADEYEKSKIKFLTNINKIMRKQSMMVKQQNTKRQNQNNKNIETETKELTKTQINVFKNKNRGKKLQDMSPKSQLNLVRIINLKQKARKIHQNLSNSFNNSLNQNSSDDEGYSFNSDSVLTEELDNVEQYKQRLKDSHMKFHKLHLKRLVIPMHKNSDINEVKNPQNNFLDFLFNDDSPTKKNQKIKQIMNAQKEKQEDYNVFGQYNDFSRQLQIKFKETVHRLLPSRDIIKYVEYESKKIHHKMTTMNTEKNAEMHKMSYRNFAETTINVIQKMAPLFEEGMKSINDRNTLDNVLGRIYQESLKTKNLAVQILCTQAHAKVSKLNKNFAKAIELYKLCKNCAEIPMLFNYRLTCYKNLGYCFSQLKMNDFAMFYYCKMLRIAWYQNNRDAELKAYDLIGMQYYYQGKLEIAQYYHNKMISGSYEKEDSDMRRLGISKIDNQLRRQEDGATFGRRSGGTDNNLISGTSSKSKLKFKNQDQDQSCDFFISSESEEEFELPIPSKSHQQALQDNSDQTNYNLNAEDFNKGDSNHQIQEEDDMDDSREIDRNYFIKLAQKQRKFKKNQPLFYHKDTYQLKQINDQANRNIHLGAQERDKRLVVILPKKQINASSFKQIKGSTKIPYRINHLSVNRELENYQSIDGRITHLKQFNFNEQMYDQQEKQIKQQVKAIFEGLRDNLLFSIAQLEMLISKQKSPNKRKGAFMINSLYGQDPNSNNQNNNTLSQSTYTITLTQEQPQSQQYQ